MVLVCRDKALNCRLLKILFHRSIFLPKICIMKQLNMKLLEPIKYVSFDEFPTKTLQDTYPKIFVLV